MNEEIKQIAARLAGLRDAVGASPEEMAAVCHLTPEEYLRLESGSEPKMNSYFVTRRGKGVAVERVKAYKYQSLAAGFSHRKADPFLVTVHPKPEDEPMFLNTHPGQEFNFVVLGRLLLSINGKEVILEPGDSIYFNSELPHGMKALDGEKVCFLAVIM